MKAKNSTGTETYADLDFYNLHSFARGAILADIEPVGYNLDNNPGGTYRDKPIADLDRVIDQIDSGNSHKITGNNTITYTFLDEGDGLIGIYNNPKYNFTAGYGLAAFTPEQEASARQSIALWDDIIAPEFVEKNGRGADIQLANSWDPAQGYAYYPSEKSGYKYFGDVFIADPRTYYDEEGTLLHRGNYTNGELTFGSYGAATMVHELGHAIGLSHPGAYNFGPGFSSNYVNGAEYAQDSEQYTIMSYWDASHTGARIIDWGVVASSNPQTPLLHDIYVAQSKYGADLTTRADDTTYGFNSTADKAVYDFSQNEFPYLSIYDAGGVDTLDFSGFETGAVLNLNDGEFSSAGQANVTVADMVAALEARNDAFEAAYGRANVFQPLPQSTIDSVMNSYMVGNAAFIAADWGHAGVLASEYDNISIAYGTVIENAVGTDYRDLIIANEYDNVLTGGGGDDVFIFLDGGHDTITDFVSGNDLIDLSAFGISSDEVTLSEGVLEADLDSDGDADLTLTFSNGAELTDADVFYG